VTIGNNLCEAAPRLEPGSAPVTWHRRHCEELVVRNEMTKQPRDEAISNVARKEIASLRSR
jgi:hypothetical protein